MATYYAAVDMGASSGRLILGHMENGKMELEEIHRFENGMVKTQKMQRDRQDSGKHGCGYLGR